MIQTTDTIDGSGDPRGRARREHALLVQLSPFALAPNGAAMTGEAGPVDTHLFLHGDEPDELMQRLLAMGANTCYLHASLGAALQASVHVTLNGAAMLRGLLDPG